LGGCFRRSRAIVYRMFTFTSFRVFHQAEHFCSLHRLPTPFSDGRHPTVCHSGYPPPVFRGSWNPPYLASGHSPCGVGRAPAALPRSSRSVDGIRSWCFQFYPLFIFTAIWGKCPTFFETFRVCSRFRGRYALRTVVATPLIAV